MGFYTPLGNKTKKGEPKKRKMIAVTKSVFEINP
jgi:hypothetical protein